MDTIAIFCTIDDFCQWFEPWWEQRLLARLSQLGLFKKHKLLI
jgi:hypothetical protein